MNVLLHFEWGETGIPRDLQFHSFPSFIKLKIIVGENKPKYLHKSCFFVILSDRFNFL